MQKNKTKQVCYILSHLQYLQECEFQQDFEYYKQKKAVNVTSWLDYGNPHNLVALNEQFILP